MAAQKPMITANTRNTNNAYVGYLTLTGWFFKNILVFCSEPCKMLYNFKKPNE